MRWHGKVLDQGSLEHGKKICSSFKSNEVVKIKSNRKSRNKSEKFSKKESSEIQDVTETALTKHHESLKRAREAGPSSGRPVQKLRVCLPHNVFHRPAPTPRPSYAAPRLPPPPRQLTVPAEQPNIMAPRQNDGLCRQCGQPGHRTPCPPVGRKRSCRSRHSSNRNTKQCTMSGGQVTHVKMEEARESPKIVMGTLLVNSMPASVYFDSGDHI